MSDKLSPAGGNLSASGDAPTLYPSVYAGLSQPPPGGAHSGGFSYSAGGNGGFTPEGYGLRPPTNAYGESAKYGSQHKFGYGSHQCPPAVWMPRPTVPNCPAGLEYLTQVNQLLIKQKIELLEMLTNVETSNQYVCMNTMGQTIYHCREESNFCMRQCCKSGRAFTMHIHDNTGTEVIRVNRPYKYTCLSQCFSCMDCCQDEVEVEAPIGYVVGYVKQIMTDCTVRFQVQDAHRNSVLQIRGPSYCYCSCFGQDIPFVVTSVDGVSEIGRITKQWSNIMQELLTDADNFGVTFPLDLDVRVKATLLGAVFLIDFMFFEHNEQNNND